MKTYTFKFDGAEFQVMADSLLNAFAEANVQVRAAGVDDAFAWFDAGPDTYALQHHVLLD
jgi:hypothetical protein